MGEGGSGMAQVNVLLLYQPPAYGQDVPVLLPLLWAPSLGFALRWGLFTFL